jgi:pimeloyl-ACP methyl ester carboxylesterase
MHYWLEDYPDYARFLISQIFTEPYSTKPIEDFVGWASETTGEVLVNTRLAKGWGQDDFERMVLRVRCPALHVHGTADSVRHHNISEKLAELTGGELVLFEGSGHAPQARRWLEPQRQFPRLPCSGRGDWPASARLCISRRR